MIAAMEQAQTESQEKPATADSLIVLFDGTCGLCDNLVNFLLKHDKKKRFRFSPQQLQPARDLMSEHNLDPDQTNSVVLIDGDHAYTRSSAVLRIATELPDPWPLAGLLVFLPVGLRDTAYDFIARHRKQWFKPRQACRMPTPEERERFVV
jgi:predicted DCC family thiol-disulfide oxidoreductase YuxK